MSDKHGFKMNQNNKGSDDIQSNNNSYPNNEVKKERNQ